MQLFFPFQSCRTTQKDGFYYLAMEGAAPTFTCSVLSHMSETISVGVNLQDLPFSFVILKVKTIAQHRSSTPM
jgi:hypothetical protein